MVDTIATVWVPVADMNRALDFYRETLGLEVESSSDQWSEVKAGTLTIGLNGYEETSRSSTAGGAVITFTPEGSIEQERDRLQQRGVSFDGDIAEYEWGSIVPFKDSEGNELQLFTAK